MQITRAGEYGVLGVLHLARRAPGQRVMVEEVSQEEQIPKSFLGKIFQSLVRTGIVRSNRGTGGGFALVKRPEEITVLEVIEAVEGKIALQRCLQDPPGCRHATGCPLCSLWEKAQDQVKAVFAGTTFADLAKAPVAVPGPRSRTEPRAQNHPIEGRLDGEVRRSPERCCAPRRKNPAARVLSAGSN